VSISDRVRILKNGNFSGTSVLYWLNRDKRLRDNWALLFSQKIAIKNKVPLIVCFQYIGEFPTSNIRQYGFLFKGMEELEKELRKLNINFFLLRGKAQYVIPKLIEKQSVGAIITDYTPIKIYRKRLNQVLGKVNIPVYQVDTHNIVPCWVSSDKKEYAAYTIRKKIQRNLDFFLTDIPQIINHPYGQVNQQIIKWEKILSNLNVDNTIEEISWMIPGENAAAERLRLLKINLDGYHHNRNDPTIDALSNLSPYFHFGHISPQRVAWEIKTSSLHDRDKDSFLEELIIRRELSDNFCEYETNYDYFEGFHSWAQKTLNAHRNDEREFLYSVEQFESGETHDPLWNAAQNQMINTGKMHGYMRMYWAKKILEWSSSPELAIQTAIDLNDKYELDGRDPNGYTGIAWSIGGVHDRAWYERPIYGKIRYMNYNGCKNKFDIKLYISRYT
tara:strand:+ start:53159 stop:54496 length:1338 start_codon:yes stop_codon:yes gene_type:complete